MWIDLTTCEDRVVDALYRWLVDRQNCHILSFHPPSGKAYGTDLLRISKKSAGVRTRERFHVDLVFTEGSFLFLAELKCRLSECNDDIAKLREIRDTYELVELLDLICRRMTTGWQVKGIQTLVLCLGFEILDRQTLPGEFLTFCTDSHPPRVIAGQSVPVGAEELFV